MTAAYNFHLDMTRSYELAVHSRRRQLVASGHLWWRNCVEMYAWEGGRA